jgi:hypothetical protein
MQRSEWRDANTTLAKRPTKISKKATIAFLQRCRKRALRACGKLPEEPQVFWKYVFEHNGETVTGQVYAVTRSEARSIIKQEHQLKRVPVGARIEEMKSE